MDAKLEYLIGTFKPEPHPIKCPVQTRLHVQGILQAMDFASIGKRLSKTMEAK
jgi:hypothetical protein